jgi:hypothetical protein
MSRRRSRPQRAATAPAERRAQPAGTAPAAPRLIEAHKAALRYFGAGGGAGAARQSIGRFLVGTLAAAIGLPVLFYLRFGRLDEFGWGFTVFVVTLSLLAAFGIYVADRPHFHSPVPLHGDWLDAIGAFWLVACALGPFIGWLLTTFLTVTVDNWRILYAGRTFFAGVLPVVTALPLTRYARGSATVMALVLLIGVTALPLLSTAWPTLDLLDGAAVRKVALVPADEPARSCLTLEGGTLDIFCDALAWGRVGDTVEVTYLRHSNRLLAVRRLTSTAKVGRFPTTEIHEWSLAKLSNLP